MASVLHLGSTRAAPKIWAERVRWFFLAHAEWLATGAEGRVPRFAQRRVILFFWPIRASSRHQISMAVPGGRQSLISATLAGKFF